MLLGDVLYESGAKLQHAYFPTTEVAPEFWTAG